MVQHSHFSGEFLLHLGQLYYPIYPHGPPELAIADTILLGGLQGTLNESISVSPASMWDGIFIVHAIYGLQAILNESISAALVSVSMYY